MQMTLPSRKPHTADHSGFTLIEILMVLMLIAIMSTLGIELIADSTNEAKFEETLSRMRQVQNAMIGDPNIREAGIRTSFGFLGDIGAIPTAAQGIAALTAQPAPALPVYAINATVRFGFGWNGPYLSQSSTGLDYTQDGWGRTYTYSPAANPPTFVSLGADGAVGGTGFNQDITFTLSNELRTTTVNGFICDNAGPFTGANAQVEMNYPNGAAVLTQSLATLTAVDKGKFSFASVPLGVRSITAYIPSKAGATTTVGPVLITVDRPNYVVPCNQLDINP